MSQGQHAGPAQAMSHPTTTERHGLLKQKCVWKYSASLCDAPSVVSEGQTAVRMDMKREQYTDYEDHTTVIPCTF